MATANLIATMTTTNEDKLTKLICDDESDDEYLPHGYKKHPMLLHKRNARNRAHKIVSFET